MIIGSNIIVIINIIIILFLYNVFDRKQAWFFALRD